VKISAAISTSEAIQEIAERFRAETGVAVETNLGSSADLARQIEQGASADLFLSADEAWADYLQERNLVGSRRDLLSNRLVLVTPVEASIKISSLKDLSHAGIKRLALAGPAVPAGRYARTALEKAALWDQLQSLVLDGQNVRAALTYVAHHEAEAGIVYATDAKSDPKVRVACVIPADYHPPIRYPLVLLAREPIRSSARRLYEYLDKRESAEVFRAAGFGMATDFGREEGVK
jgi:molybdate transport system substrate-binding protein